MLLPPLLLQTAGSLVAIVALAGLARWLRLGGAPLIVDDEMVRRAAHETEGGFVPVATARDAENRGAVARDAQGRIIVIKRHGNRFAGRMLGPQAQAKVWSERGSIALEVDCGETRFGKVFLDIPNAQAWADAINTLHPARDA